MNFLGAGLLISFLFVQNPSFEARWPQRPPKEIPEIEKHYKEWVLGVKTNYFKSVLETNRLTF